ncbi:MAG: hydroxymethylbilane synthase [Candidatus Eremiobacteraeota bacterium]|nr:hydroxymethylbilane synthase [Candidatus Eremiobacteraeota bacterium]MBC5828526.1 hydroxymethylbilane synthase [Candidatus Eremiobacteraeota bacterium]
MKPLRVATRKSALAKVQAAMVVDRIEADSQIPCTVVGITTLGDMVLDKSLSQIGGDGVFVKELERALLDGRADIAVHSLKDLPTELPSRLRAGAILPRGDARDVLVSRDNVHDSIAALPRGAIVGTSSLRRRSQLAAVRPDLRIVDLRGNVNTRIGKVLDGYFDAAVLALAGLDRAGLLPDVCGGTVLSVADMVPAVGQGALFAQCRCDDVRSRRALAPLNDVLTATAVTAERAFLKRIGGGCAAAVGCHVALVDGMWNLDAFAGSIDGKRVLRRQWRGRVCGETELISQAENVAGQMLDSGAAVFLAHSQSGSAVAQ